MKVARRICKARSDVIFVVAGGEEIHYGWDKLHTGAPSFKEWVLRRAELRPRPVHLHRAGSCPSNWPTIFRIERPAHLPDGPVRALVVAAGRDGERLRGAGLGRSARARGDRAGPRTAWSSRSSTSIA